MRVLLGLLLALFLSGYSLIAALFPGRDDPDGTRTDRTQFQARAIAVVPLIVLGLNYTPYGIQLVSILVVLSEIS